MYITVTSLRLRKLTGFFKLTLFGMKISRQAMKQSGFVKLRNRGFGYLHYTLTAWESKEALKNFAHSGAHKDAMKQSKLLATEIRTHTYESDQFPRWNQAIELLNNEGKVMMFGER
ncbi:MAG: DUF3291 domain-containing protein [Chlorobi bacterium CHB2]|nr:DUF3291 domain-containing protein [Chlorobi bacterium CHB2]